MTHPRRAVILAALALSLRPTCAQTEAVVLTIQQAQEAPVQLRLSDILALPQQEFQAHTPWYKGAAVFRGPLLRDVLAAADVRAGQSLQATALDDYKINIPWADAQTHDVIVAHTINGLRLTPRTKGPLFVVYPFDDDPDLQAVKYYERSIWQLRTLDVQ